MTDFIKKSEATDIVNEDSYLVFQTFDLFIPVYLWRKELKLLNKSFRNQNQVLAGKLL